MNNYQYLSIMEGDSKAFFIILAFIICVVIALYIYFRFFASSGEEYIEVAGEDEDEEPYIPEDTKYRVDWLTVLMNYVILGYGQLSDEPKISAFKPKDGVSVLRITDKDKQFNITVYWFKRKVELSGLYLPNDICDEVGVMTMARHKFRWKGYEVPYAEVDKFLAKFKAAEDDFYTRELQKKLTRQAGEKFLIKNLIDLTLDDPLIIPKEGDEYFWIPMVLKEFIRTLPTLPKEEVVHYLASLGVLITYLAMKYGQNWLQNWFDEEEIKELVKKLNTIKDDGAAPTAEESISDEEE